MTGRHRILCLIALATSMALGGCYRQAPRPTPTPLPTPTPIPTQRPTDAPDVIIDGSAVVAPLTRALAAAFAERQPAYRIEIGTTGTSYGIERLCRGELDIAQAIRPISDSERLDCLSYGTDWLELTFAYQALAVLVGAQNPAECLTLEELRMAWDADAPNPPVTWSDLRPELPDWELNLYGPEANSPQMLFFSQAILGPGGRIRDDAVLGRDVVASAIGTDAGALGVEDWLATVAGIGGHPVSLDGGHGCVEPSPESIWAGAYPLARPVYYYVNLASLRSFGVALFLTFTLSSDGIAVISETPGYMPAPQGAYSEGMTALQKELGG